MSSPTRKWGAVTVERHAGLAGEGIYLHVWHAGVDITTRCVFATDEGEGWALVIARGGHVRVRVDGIALVEGEPLPTWGPEWLATRPWRPLTEDDEDAD